MIGLCYRTTLSKNASEEQYPLQIIRTQANSSTSGSSNGQILFQQEAYNVYPKQSPSSSIEGAPSIQMERFTSPLPV